MCVLRYQAVFGGDKTIDEELVIKNLADVKEVFDRFNVRYWLDYGTLLGAVRDGRLIRWDVDIDLGMMTKDWEKIVSTFSELGKKGFRIYFEEEVRKKVSLHRFGYPVDISLYSNKGDWAVERFITRVFVSRSLAVLSGLLVLGDGWVQPKYEPMVKVIRECTLLFPSKVRKQLSNLLKVVRKITTPIDEEKLVAVPRGHFEKLDDGELCGMRFNIPSDVGGYLRIRYGHDWKTPKKEWNWIEEDGAVRTIKGRFAELFSGAMQ